MRIHLPVRLSVCLLLAPWVAWGAEAAKLSLVPSAQREGAPEKAAALFTAGQKALSDLKFEEAAQSLSKGVEAALSDPAQADYPSALEALVSIAVAYFRLGEEKKAQEALLELARLSLDYKLVSGFPPVFLRELEKAKKKVQKGGQGLLTVDGPPGSTAFIDGRDLGMVPVEEKLPLGTHYVKVEGARGERFGQQVEVKGTGARVTGAFASSPEDGPAREVRVAAVKPSVEPEVEPLTPKRKPVPQPELRAFERKSTLELEGKKKPEEEGPKVRTGVSAWVWVLVGVGVAGAAGGSYYGLTEMNRPVTGTVTARW